MSSYVVLARKWRPAQFSDIVGQGPVVRTLMNAIQAQRIHQAYLFTGSRGIGKTSIARIFAKAVRCGSTELKDGSLRSCDQCSSCKEISLGTSVDVIEIDGASNNGVDAIRDIRENAKYLPSSGNRKIYIIDEVHMLTTAAFNALLKTLEEPPAHVIFVFATTEPHKIPATILSRCQRFDFKRVTPSQIQARITEVMQAEGVQADPGALALIARAAEGSMRDALSILDQVIAFCGNRITVEATRESIGVLGSQTVLGILKGVLDRKPLEAIQLVTRSYEQGHDLKVLAKSLIEFLYGVILAKIGSPVPALLEASAEEWKEIEGLASLRPLEELELIFQVLNHGQESIARAAQPKIVLDILLIKCATAETLIAFDEVTNGPAPTAAPTQSVAKPVVATPTLKAAPTAPIAPEIIAPSNPGVPSAASIAASLSRSRATAPAATAAPVAAVAPTPAPKATAPTAPQVRSWEGFVNSVRVARPLLATTLEYAAAAEMPDLTSATAELIVAFKPEDSYKKDQLLSRAYVEELNGLARDYFGKVITIKALVKEGLGETLVSRREREQNEREQTIRKNVYSHPIIQEAKTLFGGDLGPVEFLEENGGLKNVHP